VLQRGTKKASILSRFKISEFVSGLCPFSVYIVVANANTRRRQYQNRGEQYETG
jgi:hypothetical protein